MKTYRTTVERDGKWWVVSVPEIDGLTQARNLAEAEKMARSLIAITLDVEHDSFDIELAIDHVGDVADVSAQMADIAELRERSALQEREATAKATALAKQLANEGLTMRDIGSVLGVTFQRAHQLVS
jgi:predicted RNase H-like HicB family nuclease